MVNGTIVIIVSMWKIVYVAFKPLLMRILYVWVCDVLNMLTSLTLKD
ncbi:MAG: hypothetical protein QXY40_08905 [Candidatus Methanomethylicia archaeon]